MAVRWEYLVVVRESNVKKAGETWEYLTEWFFYWPAATQAEKRLQDRSWGFIQVFNELGADGWEMVAETVTHSLMSTVSEWARPASRPLQFRWTFKRISEG